MKAKKIAVNGLFIALVFLATYLLHIPAPNGYVNIGDTIIFITAVLLGRNSAFIAGACGSALSDLALGYSAYAPYTFLVKGIEGFLAGLIISAIKTKKPFAAVNILAFAAGAVFMVGGYFVTDLILYGLGGAIADIPGNLIQGGSSILMGYILSGLLGGEKLKKYL